MGGFRDEDDADVDVLPGPGWLSDRARRRLVFPLPAAPPPGPGPGPDPPWLGWRGSMSLASSVSVPGYASVRNGLVVVPSSTSSQRPRKSSRTIRIHGELIGREGPNAPSGAAMATLEERVATHNAVTCASASLTGVRKTRRDASGGPTHVLGISIFKA
ncbi:hypothetical protein C8Q80DRAFT_1265293 [Daedaleopsis nitida]|nr:hypothetical protein C8Q80DRAFT_1265293 [Daedaleopsis nitida]